MKTIAHIFSALLLLILFACGGNSNTANVTIPGSQPAQTQPATPPNDGKGVGEITSVSLNDPLDATMINRGKGVYEMKCAACHKLSAQRVVGPGWQGLTTKRKPEWIMNMITNVDIMLEQDPTAQALLKECLVRMPNQNLSIGDARDVLEFMYDNDKQTAAGQ
ncbi:MAG: hypothetical protein OHK0039_21240 [Bacteroidia bacterium]